MTKTRKFLAGALGISLLWAGAGWAAGLYTNGVPAAGGTQYPSTIPLTGNETLPADTNLTSGLNPASEAISTNQLASFIGAQPAKGNVLIGGDAGTNLWQRGTTGSSVTTTVTYGGPDRWAYWSGTNTAMTVTQSNTAAALPGGFAQTFRMQRTASQTGVVQVCMAQEIESANSYQFQGSTAELDFHAYTGANFSAASSNMTAYIITGTGSDEGMSKMAWGLNAGGGGSTAWTGQANATAAVISLQAVSTLGRYAAVAAIPATATEIGVALCYTPVGTAGTTDAIYFSGIQLIRNNSVSAYASTTVGYNDASTTTSFPASSFERRLQGVESLLQYRYYYELDESAAIYIVAPCAAVDTSHTNCIIQFPAVMRIAPTLTFANGFASPTSTTQATLGACTTLSAAVTVTSTVASLSQELVNCAATTIPAAGVASFLYSNAGSGKIKASSEL